MVDAIYQDREYEDMGEKIMDLGWTSYVSDEDTYR